MSPDLNPHAEAARLTKAFNLAVMLRKAGIDHADAARMTAEEWEMLAHAAKVNMPSERSRLMTLAKLKAMEAPLEGMVAA